MTTLNRNKAAEAKVLTDELNPKDAIRMALVEGELSGESDLSVLDIIKQQKESLRE
jgi:hypothetical protein